MVTLSNRARSLGNLYSAYPNPIKILSCFQAHMNLSFRSPPLGPQVIFRCVSRARGCVCVCVCLCVLLSRQLRSATPISLHICCYMPLNHNAPSASAKRGWQVQDRPIYWDTGDVASNSCDMSHDIAARDCPDRAGANSAGANRVGCSLGGCDTFEVEPVIYFDSDKYVVPSACLSAMLKLASISKSKETSCFEEQLVLSCTVSSLHFATCFQARQAR